MSDALNALLNICENEQEKKHVTMSKFFDDLFEVFHNHKNAINFPYSIETSYAGLHLNDHYEENDFIKMMDEFRNGNIIHAKYALKIIVDAIDLYKKIQFYNKNVFVYFQLSFFATNSERVLINLDNNFLI